MAELKEIAASGIKASRVGQILVEKSVAGYKEIEFEVMRDKTGNAIIVCDIVGKILSGFSILIIFLITSSFNGSR